MTLIMLVVTIKSTCYNYDNGDIYPDYNTSYCCNPFIIKQGLLNGQSQIKRSLTMQTGTHGHWEIIPS